MAFDGYLKLYPDQDKDKFLPELAEKDAIKTQEIEGKQHFTEPAARYSDATLVKALEELGIGRPSTYAPTISTVIDRGYVERDEKKRLLPTDIGYEVTDLLVANFPDIVDFEFTARMENSLDNIAEGRMDWRPLISAFYGPFKITLDKREKDLAAEAEKEAEGVTCPKCDKPMTIKHGRFGKFLACVGYPECKGTRQMPGEATR